MPYRQKRKRGKLEKTLHKYELTATNNSPTKTMTKTGYLDKRGRGNTKQIDYIMIRKNIATWLNYSKAKGAANTNHANQHNIICMDIRVKLKTQEDANSLRKHINFNINLLSENTQKLLISEDNEERIIIRKYARNLETAQHTTRSENNEL